MSREDALQRIVCIGEEQLVNTIGQLTAKQIMRFIDQLSYFTMCPTVLTNETKEQLMTASIALSEALACLKQ